VSALPDIRSLNRDEVTGRLAELGAPSYRVHQLLDWLYPKAAASWDEMTNLPRALRRTLASEWTLNLPRALQVQGATDSTRKFLWQLRDDVLIESVLIPATPALYGEASDRHTFCVSTQVGCAYGCRFCASGLLGWKRNLTTDEIVGQVVAVERWHRQERHADGVNAPVAAGEPSLSAFVEGSTPGNGRGDRLVNNLVIMGMGEPLANYDNLMAALRILNAPWGMGIGARKITISTSGLAPEIRRLADEPHQFGLALSLHGATDAVRERLMPVNRKYPLAELVGAAEEFLRAKGRTITLEYILIRGVNDDLSEVKPLAAMARRLRAKVNLIPYNRVEGLTWERPSERRQQDFFEALTQRAVRATLRREKGHDIDAACGQLRLRNSNTFTGGDPSGR
jgi:23S rRNA (adenine2503-C2)-methyltransferase